MYTIGQADTVDEQLIESTLMLYDGPEDDDNRQPIGYRYFMKAGGHLTFLYDNEDVPRLYTIIAAAEGEG